MQDQAISENGLVQNDSLRQIVLDTETTGLDAQTERVIEIGCVELVNRRLTHNNYHQYINPLKEIEKGAYDVHGISTEFLSDKPLFGDVVHAFIDYVKGAELVIHNASFDVGFLNAEMQNFDPALGKIGDYCNVVDSLALARELHPGQRNDLDTLAKRYGVDNSHRTLHGALLDSEILADVYLLMSGTQHTLELKSTRQSVGDSASGGIDFASLDLPVLAANNDELAAHQDMLNNMDKSGVRPIWMQTNSKTNNSDG